LNRTKKTDSDAEGKQLFDAMSLTEINHHFGHTNDLVGPNSTVVKKWPAS